MTSEGPFQLYFYMILCAPCNSSCCPSTATLPLLWNRPITPRPCIRSTHVLSLLPLLSHPSHWCCSCWEREVTSITQRPRDAKLLLWRWFWVAGQWGRGGRESVHGACFLSSSNWLPGPKRTTSGAGSQWDWGSPQAVWEHSLETCNFLHETGYWYMYRQNLVTHRKITRVGNIGPLDTENNRRCALNVN